MKRNFLELQKFLERRYPQLIGNIQGENYPPSPTSMFLAQMAGLTQVLGFILVIFGGPIFSMLGVPEPSWLLAMKANKMMCVFGLFFMNSIVGSITQTGAFEVYVNGNLIFSKLQTGRMPQISDIINAFEAIGIRKMV